ncbi:hypothetical protein N8083_02095 [Candidatus Pacebacteria bacterium]|nr:hypothetical protein [Candidatus Paceibacterota bacterium]
MIIDFAVVIFVQFVVFILAALFYKKKISGIFRVLFISTTIGLVAGLGSDYFLGQYHGLFHYELGFGFLFLVCNGIFSYGLFAALFGLSSDVRGISIASKYHLLIYASIIPIILILAYVDNVFIQTTTLGVLMLWIAESVLAFTRVRSPILSLNVKKVFEIYLLSVYAGITYEIINYFFQVWNWNIFPEAPAAFSFVMIIFCGYFGGGYMFWSLYQAVGAVINPQKDSSQRK